MANKHNYGGKIEDLPVVTGGHFIDNSEKRIIYGPNRFWDDYVVRAFTLHPGAGSTEHSHPWNHWTICTQGSGEFYVGDEVYELSPNSYVFVPGNVPHFFPEYLGKRKSNSDLHRTKRGRRESSGLLRRLKYKTRR